MKKLLILFAFLLSGILVKAQDTPPTGVNFKTLSTYSFKYDISDSTIWQYKGALYGWTKLTGDLRHWWTKIDSVVGLDTSFVRVMNRDTVNFSIYKLKDDSLKLFKLKTDSVTLKGYFTNSKARYYRLLTNHDSLSKLDERKYQSLTDTLLWGLGLNQLWHTVKVDTASANILSRQRAAKYYRLINDTIRLKGTATIFDLLSKVNVSDTAAMLQNYINEADTALMLSKYLHIGDTANMLSDYINKADTSAMLSKYATDVNLSYYRRLNNHDSLNTLQEKSYNSLNDKPNLAIYRQLNNHDSLSTLDEKSYASLTNKPAVILVGDTAAMLSKYATDVNLTYKEDKSNKVTSISAGSTDIQYGSAKLTYDQLALKAPVSVYPATGLTTGYIPYKTATVLANSGLFYDGTNFCIGGTSSNNLLSIQTAANSVIDMLSLNNTSNVSSGSRILFINGYGNLGAIKVAQRDNGALADDGAMELQTASNSTLSTKVTILNNGNVVIGGTDPLGYKFYTNGTGGFATSVTTPTILLTTGAQENYYWKSTGTTGAGVWAAISASQFYNGAWDANTNTPTLADGTGTQGTYYHCTVSGTVDFDGAGGRAAIAFTQYVDDVAYNGAIWEKIPNAQYQLLTMSASVIGGAKLGGSLQVNSDILNINNFNAGALTITGTGSDIGKIWTLNDKVVTLAKMNDMATASFLGRNTALTGVPEVLSTATVKTMLGLGTAAYATIANYRRNNDHDSLNTLQEKSYNSLTDKPDLTAKVNVSDTASMLSKYATDVNLTYKEDKSNKVTSISGASTDIQYGSAKLLYDQLVLKVPTARTITTTAPLTIAGTTSADLSANRTIAITQAATAANGYLSSTDWNTFNGKQSALTNPITGTGTTNYVTKFTGTSTVGNSLIYDNGTNVGIGTTNPGALLQIEGGTSADALRLGITASDQYYKIGRNGSYGKLTFSGQQQSYSGYDFQIYPTGGAVGTSALVIKEGSGNVGIGTSAPFSILTLGQITGIGAELTYEANADAAARRWKLASDRLVFGDFAIQQSTTQYGNTWNSKIYINPTGNVGIGTTGPGSLLDIYGASPVLKIRDSGVGLGSGGQLSLGAYAGTLEGARINASLIDGDLQKSSLVFSTLRSGTVTEAMRILDSGNVGIGTISPTAVLHLKAGTATASTAPLKFTSGVLNTTAEAGAVEFLTDAFYGTITTGAVRKTFAFLESPIFTGTVTMPVLKVTTGAGVGKVLLSDAAGLLSYSASTINTGAYATAYVHPNHSGDATGATALTLATVNANVGTYNNITINGKGLATAGSNVAYLTTVDISANTNLSATAPIVLTGDVLSISAATTLAPGSFSAADKTKLDGIAAGANTGTVTSVAMSVPTGLSISGTPITTSGTLALTLTSGYAIPTTTNISTWNGLVTFPGFGTSHSTSAYGDHNHSGVYDPAGTTSTHAALTTTAHGLGASAFHADAFFQAALTFGIANTNAVQINSAYVTNGEYAKFTSTGLESRNSTEVIADIGAITAAAVAASYQPKITTGTTAQYFRGDLSLATFPTSMVSNIAAGTSGNVMTSNGSVWTSAAPTGGSGITSLGGLTAATQTFAIGTTGTAPNWSSATSTHTLHIPMAVTTSVTAGLISKAEYDIFNAKAAAGQTFYIGTTQVAINRASGALALTGTSIDGNAGTVTVAANTDNATYYPLFSTSATGSLAPKTTAAKLTFNPSTGILVSTNFQASDIRLKKNINPIDFRGLKTNKVQWVQYTKKDDKTNTLHYGVSAQKLEQIFPSMVNTATDSLKTKSVNYTELLVLKMATMEANQAEMQQEIKVLQNKVNALERKFNRRKNEK